jgi:endonuclease-3 related protein
VSWRNVEKAISNLKAARVLSPHALREIDNETLGELIKPSLYFNNKTLKIKAFLCYLEKYAGNLTCMFAQSTEILRSELLSIYGIGEETADDILLYAAKKPIFVIDFYTRRIFQRLHLAPPLQTYTAYQELFHSGLQLDFDMYGEYHALIDQHGAETCRKNPICKQCCLITLCPTGQSNTATI